MENLYSEYKKKKCTECQHYKDKDYKDCELKQCVDGKVRCEHYSKKEY